MIKLQNVRGSKEQAQELIIGVDTVYEHSNIKKLEFSEDDPMYGSELYEYDEVQYTLDEWNNKSTNPYGIPDIVYNAIKDNTIQEVQDAINN